MNAVYCKSMVTLAAACALLCCLLALHSCVNRTVAGGGADVGNPTASVKGRAAYENSNTAAAGASVYLRDVNYVRAIEDSARPVLVNARCDDSGSFSIDSIVPGDYFLEISSENGFAALARCTIVDSTTRIDLGRMAIKRTGAVRGAMPAELRGNSSWYAQIFGMDRIATVNQQTGIFEFPDLPEGTFTIRLKPTSAAVAPIMIDTVIVRSGAETVVSSYPQWLFSKVLKLNTTANGADVNGTVTGFPVLLRLTTSNFDFSQAKGDGGDIRFTKSNGAPLPFEIERWDAISGLAEVWVKVDTVYGNDSAQSVLMYWGAVAIASMSDGPAVFDTANGFQGVWHLAEAGNAIMKDATGNHYNGTPSDTAPLGVEGAIGPCRSFNGSSNFISMNGTATGKLNFPENGIYTVSAWAYANAIDYGSHLIVGKSNEQYAMKFKFSVLNSPMVWELSVYRDSMDWCSTNSLPVAPSAKTWTYITGIRNGTAQYFFLNGELVDSSISVSSGSRPPAQDVTIGRFLSKPPDSIEGICPFLGTIDEVRISNVANSADWIKLCFMNQKNPDALVKW